MNRVQALASVVAGRVAKRAPSVGAYWSAVNVTQHRRFASAEESLAQLAWRNDQYIGYAELMPVRGFDGLTVLDFGCGPGLDLVGFVTESAPERLIGIDLSRPSLDEAAERLSLHGASAELVHLKGEHEPIPLEDASVDYLHCSGVLHHVSDQRRVLREFRRVLKPDGFGRLMVYHRESVFFHLHVGYLVRLVNGQYADLSIDEAFRRSTDGEHCPISRANRVEDVEQLFREEGFDCRFLGAAISALELVELGQHRWQAVLDARLEREHRSFLVDLELDARGLPTRAGVDAGVDACFEFRPR